MFFVNSRVSPKKFSSLESSGAVISRDMTRDSVKSFSVLGTGGRAVGPSAKTVGVE